MLQKQPIYWKNVVFSDETIIELNPNRKIQVRRPPKSAIIPKYCSQYSKFGGKRLMFWGFIKENGEKLLVEVRGTLISVSYINVLANNLLPNMYLVEMFQQDNAPCHNSQVTKTWMLENGIELLENWPPQSPDINIIENH